MKWLLLSFLMIPVCLKAQNEGFCYEKYALDLNGTKIFRNQEISVRLKDNYYSISCQDLRMSIKLQNRNSNHYIYSGSGYYDGDSYDMVKVSTAFDLNKATEGNGNSISNQYDPKYRVMIIFSKTDSSGRPLLQKNLSVFLIKNSGFQTKEEAEPLVLFSLKIKMKINSNGDAIFVEKRSMNITNREDEGRIMLKNLKNVRISDFWVRDERGFNYSDLSVWNPNTTRENKDGKCGILDKGNTYQLCWGLGVLNGKSKLYKEYTMGYTIKSFVKGYDDVDGFSYNLLETGSNPLPKYIELEIEFPADDEGQNYILEAFGFSGKKDVAGGKYKILIEEYSNSDSIKLIGAFRKGLIKYDDRYEGSLKEFLDIDTFDYKRLLESKRNTISKENSEEDAVPYAIVEQKPLFNGGDAQAFTDWIYANLEYPQKAKEDGIRGRVTVEFLIDKEGNAINAKVLRGVEQSLDNEALRVVGMCPKWKPGRQKGQAVYVKYTMPIIFDFNQEQNTSLKTEKKIKKKKKGRDFFNALIGVGLGVAAAATAR